jgi:hypothetical protein
MMVFQLARHTIALSGQSHKMKIIMKAIPHRREKMGKVDFKAALKAADVSEQVIEQAARTLLDLSGCWGRATREERKMLVRTMI